MKRKRLRFGIISDSENIEDWQKSCLKKMLELESVEAGLFILLNTKKSKQKSIRTGASLTDLVNNVSFLKCESVKTGNMEHLLIKKDLKKIDEHKLDFLLNFSSRNIGGEIIDLPKYGVWVFQYSSDLHEYIGDIYNDESITFARLLKLSKENKRLPLKEGCFSTIKDSFKKNRELITSAISSWPALVCRDILNNNAEYTNHPATFVSNPYVLRPNLIQMGKFHFRMVNNRWKKIISKLFSYEYWNIGIVHKPIHEFLNDPKANIEWLVQKKDLYYADPFAYQDENGLRILMEEVDYRVVKGFISGVSVKDDVVVFDQALMKFPCHMSYPFILEHKNQIYCIPETSEAREASIYMYKGSSKEWEKVKTVLEDFHAVDSTIVKYGDTWWLFCTKSFSTVQSHNNELHIYYATDLFGEWKPHILNPVKVDIRSSRPAGTPFMDEGVLYRPAQDCSKTYGGRIAINRIKTLTITQFEEETVCYIEPMKGSLYPDGVHTISSAGGITIIDGKRFDYNFLHFFRKLYKYKPVSSETVKAGKFIKERGGKKKWIRADQVESTYQEHMNK
ncbi:MULTISPECIES: hypothetical protein [unclassified Bacillus (in: firmicutes)]|uniref:glucosamine inositolphosphorylceramide transferase family protein n=1 Tax=unclassified Bacillus (in: firmicutes) TaxID=185979 RepID=UPI0011454075|nr:MULTISPECIES: hypothetical protein [unclassified Bacillus (in: firmicutes)]